MASSCARLRLPTSSSVIRGGRRRITPSSLSISLLLSSNNATTTTTPRQRIWSLHASSSSCAAGAARRISTQPLRAKVVPIYGTGPPPEPPLPAAEYAQQQPAPGTGVDAGLEHLSTSAAAKMARRRKQAEMLKQARDIRSASSSSSGKTTSFKRRFWKDVGVKEVDGAYEIFLDSRPLRRPDTKAIIRLPLSKPHLAHAVALEWDHLVSSTEATKQHLIPLTALICRALDIADDDAAFHPSGDATVAPIRSAITTVLLRYLDTDSLLCWAPPADPSDPNSNANIVDDEGKSLRGRQEEIASGVVSFLTSRVWPGVSIVPVLDGHSIMPRHQEPGTREVVQGWVSGLDSWELAGLERATLAGKSFLAAARLVVEWSEGGAGTGAAAEGRRFGVEEAARAVNLEVDWQTGRWGEVEDTHDVEKEDVRRQLGSAMLLVSGNGQGQGGPKARL